jgi:hypothetical protein
MKITRTTFIAVTIFTLLVFSGAYGQKSRKTLSSRYVARKKGFSAFIVGH